MILSSCFVCLTVLSGITSSRVLELSDKFIDISAEGQWFVKFYAPWCAHCRRLEPIWAHVAQTLYNTPIKVAKVDCTRFPAVATHFKIRAYPTILFIKGDNHHVYLGERAKDEMVNYAQRMSQSAIQTVSQTDSIMLLKESHPVFFGYVGTQQGPLWEIFAVHAEKYQPHTWFYAMSHEVVEEEIAAPKDSAVFVHKEDEIYFFDARPSLLEDKDALNATLDKWINSERFGFFPKITRSNINDLMDTEKYIVIAVVSENKLNEITQTERDFKDMIEGIIRFDDFQPPEQAGFRKGYSTVDHIHTLRQVIQKTEEYNRPLCLAFVDYEKAFDSVETWAVLRSLQRCQIDYRYIEVLKCLYENATMSVRLQDRDTKPIQPQRGVRQGDVISPKLFTAALEDVFKLLDKSYS